MDKAFLTLFPIAFVLDPVALFLLFFLKYENQSESNEKK